MTGDEARACLAALGLSQVDAAHLLGTNDRTVRRWLQAPGEHIPGPAAQVLQAWQRLHAAGLAWRPDNLPTPWEPATREGARRLNAQAVHAAIEGVQRRGGPLTPWDVDVARGRATLGALKLQFVVLADGGFTAQAVRHRTLGPQTQSRPARSASLGTVRSLEDVFEARQEAGASALALTFADHAGVNTDPREGRLRPATDTGLQASLDACLEEGLACIARALTRAGRLAKPALRLVQPVRVADDLVCWEDRSPPTAVLVVPGRVAREMMGAFVHTDDLLGIIGALVADPFSALVQAVRRWADDPGVVPNALGVRELVLTPALWRQAGLPRSPARAGSLDARAGLIRSGGASHGAGESGAGQGSDGRGWPASPSRAEPRSDHLTPRDEPAAPARHGVEGIAS